MWKQSDGGRIVYRISRFSLNIAVSGELRSQHFCYLKKRIVFLNLTYQ